MKNEHTKGQLFLLPCLLAENTHNNVLPPGYDKIIKNINHFFVENVRTARRFIASLKLEIDIEKINFWILDKDSQATDLQLGFECLENGISVGVLSEAGCPGIADPGALAVALAHKKNIRIIPLVGPSSVLMALMSSGFSGQCFEFHGYLPIEKIEKIKLLKYLEKESSQKIKTQIFIETPYRNQTLLLDIIENLQPKTLLCVASDVTSANEFIKTQELKSWKNNIPDIHKKPTVFLLFGCG